MQNEYNLLIENHVWKLVDKQRIKPIVSRSQLDPKCGPTRETKRYKAKLVANDRL